MSNMSDFNAHFDEPLSFGHDIGYALSAELYPTEQQARQAYNETFSAYPNADEGTNFRPGFVVYSVPPPNMLDNMDERTESDGPCWWGPVDKDHPNSRAVWFIK